MSGLKQHPQHRELKAHLDTLPPGALVAEEPQVGGGGRGRAEAGACPGPWTAEKIAEQEAAAQEYLPRVGRTRQDEICGMSVEAKAHHGGDDCKHWAIPRVTP